DVRLQVEAVVGAGVHRTISVTTKRGPSGSCGGFHASTGDRIGLMAVRKGGRWQVDACSRFDASAVLATPGVHEPAPGATPGPSLRSRLLDVGPWGAALSLVVALLLGSRTRRARARYDLDADPWM